MVPRSLNVGVRFQQLLVFAFAALLFSSGCASLRGSEVPPPSTAVQPPPPPTGGKTVQASFYDQDFNGKKTASGEIFDAQKLTCAHRSLPFGTMLELKRTGSDATVQVRVNDRGPFVSGRELDLSPRAASALGIDSEGVATVEMRVLNGKSEAASEASSPKNPASSESPAAAKAPAESPKEEVTQITEPSSKKSAPPSKPAHKAK